MEKNKKCVLSEQHSVCTEHSRQVLAPWTHLNNPPLCLSLPQSNTKIALPTHYKYRSLSVNVFSGLSEEQEL